MNYGYIQKPIEPDHWVLGSDIPKETLQENGDWTPFLPKGEKQNMGVETYNCTAFGLTNLIETFIKRKYGYEINLSDRALGILAGTKEPGNDPHVVCEALRKNGDCEEFILPFGGNTTAEYFTPSPLPQNILDECKKFTDTYNFKHEWVIFNGIPESERKKILMEYLKYSPLGTAVYAWSGHNGMYYRTSPKDTHFVALVGYKENEYWIVYDSYPQDGVFLKRLHWDFGFNFAKHIFLEKKPLIEPKPQIDSLLKKLYELLSQLFAYYKK